jgi:hypothetical protein
MAGQAGRGTFFLHIPGPSGPGCRIGAPLALANVGQRPINPIAQAIGLGCMGHIIAACMGRDSFPYVDVYARWREDVGGSVPILFKSTGLN